jgi:acetylornithine deacetylase
MLSFFLLALLAAPSIAQGTQKVLENFASSREAPSWRKDLLSLHRSLVSIESISGNEYGVGNFLVEYLTERGYVAQLQFVAPQSSTPKGQNRFNVLAWRSRSRSPTPRVLVSSHIDVVPPYIPYSIASDEVSEDTIICGRGSVDAKGSVAAQIIAIQELLKTGDVTDDDIMLLFVVGEETTGDGMRFFSNTMDDLHPPPKFEAVIFGEPTENKLACGHKGALFCEIVAKGVAGHSGYPWLGKSATELMVKALSTILATDLGSSEKFGKTTVNIGRLSGGVAANVIPDYSEAALSFRVAIGPEETGSRIVDRKLRDILAAIDSESLDMTCSQGYGTVETACDVEGMLPTRCWMAKRLTLIGFDTITVNYGTDVPNLKGNHTRYLYGPGSILVAHSALENLTVGDLEASVDGYQRLILHALRPTSS